MPSSIEPPNQKGERILSYSKRKNQNLAFNGKIKIKTTSLVDGYTMIRFDVKNAIPNKRPSDIAGH